MSIGCLNLQSFRAFYYFGCSEKHESIVFVVNHGQTLNIATLKDILLDLVTPWKVYSICAKRTL